MDEVLQFEDALASLPEWKLGEREPLLLEDPLLLLMAVPLRQRLSWQGQVLPVIRHYRRAFAREPLLEFYSRTFYSATGGYRDWREGSRIMWGRAYTQSARRLYNILSYLESFAANWDRGNRRSDWELLRQALLLSREEVVGSIRGFGASSWAFLAYYLTYFPPEESSAEILQLYGEVTGEELMCSTESGGTDANATYTLDLARRAWLYLLDEGVLHERGLL